MPVQSKAAKLPAKTRRLRSRLPLGLATFLCLLVAMAVRAGSAWGQNEIAIENALPGNLASEWDVSGAGDLSIQGFATDISVDQGETVSFKIETDATDYRLDIYRLGYYGGMGARKVATVQPSASLPQAQPAPITDGATGLVDCGNWSVSASWAVPADAVSGIYFAKLVREDPEDGRASHVIFIVRDDDGGSDLLLQTNDATWQAYNTYGGNSLYFGSPAGRAYKVSYNRPFTARCCAYPGGSIASWLFSAVYPMVRWVEANGYDVSYFTGVDADRRGAEILEHEAYLSVGHDEYWSATQRASVEAARDAGVHLAFFSGNEVFWKTRWEPSIDGSGTPHRTLVCYKETHANAKIDPLPDVWTGTWRDPRFSPPADGGRPENALTGTIFTVNGLRNDAIEVPEADGKMRFWRDTGVATLAPGQTATFAAGTLGFEWDEDLDNGSRPPGVVRLSSATVSGVPLIQDHGSTYASGTATHHLTLYRHASGALVFGAGTVQWSWGLDATHDGAGPAADLRMRQATVNLFADMGVQPTTLQPGLVAATASTDATAPVSTIGFPLSGGSVPSGTAVTISGTAVDGGGGRVGGVEVSVDGGTSWHPASGRENWTFSWTPGTPGSATLRCRSADDSGNLEVPAGGITVTIDPPQPATCPCHIFTTDGGPAANDPQSVELGVRFTSDQDGVITGIRFYKPGPSNGGVHVGNLWTNTGTNLRSATFGAETSSGWQEVSFGAGNEVAITAGTLYVASVLMPQGNYAASNGFFATSGTDNPPLHAPRDGENGFPNGVYLYGAGGFPVNTFQSSNYWVDVVFETAVAPDVTPPTITAVSPGGGATDVSTGSDVTATFSEPMSAGTIDGTSFELRDPGAQLVPANVTYDGPSRTATLDPTSALAEGITYAARVTVAVEDLAGNPMAAEVAWSFTTIGPPPPPPDEGPGGPILVVDAAGHRFGRYLTEILRNEGLNHYLAKDISTVTAGTLSAYDVVLLGEMPLSAAQVTMLADWVNAGGNLIAMRPDQQLAGLLGLTDLATTLTNGYLLVDTGSGPGAGIVGQTIQYHGPADLYALSGASAVATLHSDATTPTASPAVTLRSVGPNGGQAACFTFDLARSVVYTRQGNPAWAGQERDGIPPMRADDLFYGNAGFDPQPDWVNLDKVAIPQADEQQRLLVNLVLASNFDRKPLPRFWYLPRGKKAAIVMTGDDHANGGTIGRFDQYLALSPPGCSVDDWECIRSSSYIYTATPLTDAQALAYHGSGFDIGLHPMPGCTDFTPASIASSFATELAAFQAKYTSIPAPSTNRTHCGVWSDWVTHAKTEVAHGIRLDCNYYYWPPAWVQDRPGLFNGSGMPMRFADLDGSIIDCYQAATVMTDESGQTFPFNVTTLLDRALGPEGYYGAFCANMHTDNAAHAGSDAIVAAALARGVPVVSSRQMLTWLDGRNASWFGAIAWNGGVSSFTVTAPPGARNIETMLPVLSNSGELVAITRDLAAIPFTTQTIKGVEYAFFSSPSGSYEATYLPDLAPPVITNVAADPDGDGTALVTWNTDETADSKVLYGTTPGNLDQEESSAAGVTSHSIALAGLSASTTYYYRVQSTDANTNTATEPNPPAAPLVFTIPCFEDATLADFSLGSTDVGTRVVQVADGEVVLAPEVGAEFEGPSLPSGWSGSAWSGGGSFPVAGGVLTVDGARVGTDAAFGPGRSLEFVASFGGDHFQHVALVADLDFNSPWAMFSTWTGGALYARTSDGTNLLLPGSWLGSPHRYRIDWNAGGFDFSIDGTPVATIPLAIGSSLRVVASDFDPGGNGVVVDWMRLTPYAASGSFTSRVFDAQGPASWGAASWNADTPAGTGIALSVRTGNTPTPDGSWSAFAAMPFNGAVVGGSSQYIQYRANLTTSDPGRTPTLEDVTIACEAGADDSPPVITNVAASPGPDGTTALVTWDTNEASDSRVDYGTAPGALLSSASSATLVFAHGVPLTGLTPGTTYYYRVTSADAAANDATEPAPPDPPATFTTPVAPCLVDLTTADFTLGSFGPGTYAAETGDGEVVLAPEAGAEFGGASLPSGWSGSAWSGGGSFLVAGGSLTVDGARVGTDVAFGPGRSLEFVASFGGDHFQHVALVADLDFNSPWAMFSTWTGGALYARTSDGTNLLLPGSWLGSPHRYRIDWNAGGFDFSIDGTPVATIPLAIGSSLRVVASDFDPGGNGVVVDWMRLTPYAASGSFTSRVFDAGGMAGWDIATWSADTPTGTDLAIAVRTGNSPVPDGSWTPFALLAGSGSSVGTTSRYIQYQANLTSSDPARTPTLRDLTIACFIPTATRIARFTASPEGASVRIVVELSEPASALVTIWRAPSADAAERIALGPPQPMTGGRFETLDPMPEAATWYWAEVVVGNDRFLEGPITPLGGLPELTGFSNVAPNPLVSGVTFRYTIGTIDAASGGVPVRLTIHDLQGRTVRVVQHEPQTAGRHQVEWDVRDARGARVLPGIYYYRFRAGSMIRQGKLVVLR